MPDETLAETSAPGKLVLSGEYAVLAGAPAVVAAIDRRVACRIDAREAGGWAFRSRGFDAVSRHRRDALPDVPGDPGTLVRHAIRRLGIDPGTLPQHVGIEIDSRPCYRDGAKLGLGSSAAAVVPPGEVTFSRSCAGGASDWRKSSPAPETVAQASRMARSASSPASTPASARHSASRNT